MVKVSKPQTSTKGCSATIALRLFLPCVLLVAFLDVKSFRFLRHEAPSTIRGNIDGTSDTIGSGSVASSNVDKDTIDTDSRNARNGAISVVASTEVEVSKSKDVKTDDIRTDVAEGKETDGNQDSTTISIKKNTTTTCLNPKGPQPYVLLARGRSGTDSTLQVLGTLTGDFTPGDHKLIGSSPQQVRKFFEKVGPKDEGQWVLDYFCEKQRQHPNAGVVALKWKPYSEAMFSPAALAGLELMSRAVDPIIKVVRLRRNLVDIFISDRKHELAKISSHCAPGNLRCVRQHKEAGANLTLSVADLVAFLESETNQEDTVDKFLVNMSVPHVNVSYEKLYHQDNADEWMKIFKFLGTGPGEGLTRKEVDGNAQAFTGSLHHSDAILNYDEVEQGLKGTRFESLLRW